MVNVKSHVKRTKSGKTARVSSHYRKNPVDRRFKKVKALNVSKKSTVKSTDTIKEFPKYKVGTVVTIDSSHPNFGNASGKILATERTSDGKDFLHTIGFEEGTNWAFYESEMRAKSGLNVETKPKLEIIGEDGNAFMILAKAQRVAKKNDMDWDKIYAEATDGDYNHLLRTMMKYFEVE